MSSLASKLPHNHTHTHTPRPLEHYRRLTKWRHTHTHTRQQRATPHTHTQANTHQKDFTAGPKRGVRGIQSVNKMVGTAPSLPEGETELQPCCLHVIKEQACVSERRLQDCWALKENSAVFFFCSISWMFLISCNIQTPNLLHSDTSAEIMLIYLVLKDFKRGSRGKETVSKAAARKASQLRLRCWKQRNDPSPASSSSDWNKLPLQQFYPLIACLSILQKKIS